MQELVRRLDAAMTSIDREVVFVDVSGHPREHSP
jgi:hypothetical protein